MILVRLGLGGLVRLVLGLVFRLWLVVRLVLGLVFRLWLVVRLEFGLVV